jgi:hypothetical protein
MSPVVLYVEDDAPFCSEACIDWYWDMIGDADLD